MRIAPCLVMVVAAAGACSAAGCGGAAERGGDPGSSGGADGTKSGAQPGADSKDGTAAGDGAKTQGPAGAVDPSCAKPTTALVVSGGTIARPIGSTLRLQLVYQGSSIGITSIRGVDMVLPKTDGPFSDNSGYWIESRAGATSRDQRILRDPTRLEVFPGPEGSGQGFENKTIDRCTPKPISADVPNDSAVTTLVLFGSPYGTQDRAVELAHFAIE